MQAAAASSSVPFVVCFGTGGTLANNRLRLRLRSYSVMATGTGASVAPKWAQTTITIPPHRRGCHLITSKNYTDVRTLHLVDWDEEQVGKGKTLYASSTTMSLDYSSCSQNNKHFFTDILKEIGQDLSGFRCGLAHLFLQHTSASLTINENYDSDVRDDTETFLNRVVPEGISAPWKHTLEGPDDMPAHIKSSMFGCTLTIPITNGKLNMGTWQTTKTRIAEKRTKDG